MKYLLSKLFGSDKIVDGLIQSADNIWETTEEKSKAKMLFLKLYEPFKIAQRYALLLFTIPFVMLHIAVVVSWLVSLFVIGDRVKYNFVTEQLHEIAHMNNLALGEPVLWIVGFYFLGGAGEGMIKAASVRFKK